MRRTSVVFVAGLTLAAVACSGTPTVPTAGRSTGSTPPGSMAAAPPAQPPPLITAAMLDGALGKLDGQIEATMEKTGVPGMAVAVVHGDRVVYAKGFGVREAGKPDIIDPQTVFQLASVSKPIASTVVAGVVGQGAIGWDDPVTRYDPTFALQDPWVTEHVTFADLFSHRSGLPEHAGDLLEDLGFGREEVLARLRLEPLAPFRDNYDYTNFGLTEAGVAAAKARNTTWEDLSAEVLYEPLGMTSTSSRLADYTSAPNRAKTHVDVDGAWQARFVREPDAQSPAGGVSSNLDDLTKWMRLQLGEGSVDGRQIIDPAALAQTHVPHQLIAPPRTSGARTTSYGLGWNVGVDAHGRPQLTHSGAFALGAATSVALLPSEDLGIVVLTNAAPIGAAEAITFAFLDTVSTGAPTVDWLGFLGPQFERLLAGVPSEFDFAAPPARPAAAAAADAYVGTYANEYYGPLQVQRDGDGLVLVLGPRNQRFALTHYDGNVFVYVPPGENGGTMRGVTFTLTNGRADRVVIENLNANGFGAFTR